MDFVNQRTFDYLAAETEKVMRSMSDNAIDYGKRLVAVSVLAQVYDSYLIVSSGRSCVIEAVAAKPNGDFLAFQSYFEGPGLPERHRTSTGNLVSNSPHFSDTLDTVREQYQFEAAMKQQAA